MRISKSLAFFCGLHRPGRERIAALKRSKKTQQSVRRRQRSIEKWSRSQTPRLPYKDPD